MDIAKIVKLVKCVLGKKHKPELTRWHWTHGDTGNLDIHIEAEYICPSCDYKSYLYYIGSAAKRFAKDNEEYQVM